MNSLPYFPLTDQDHNIGIELLNSEQKHQDGCHIPPDLDLFFAKVYHYFVKKGFSCILISRTTNLVSIGFTIFLSTFLLLFVDWSRVVSCSVYYECSRWLRPEILTKPTFGEVLVMMYFSVFCLYWIWHFISFVFVLRDANEMRHFYNDILRISDEELQNFGWDGILGKLVELQRKGTKLCIVKDLSPLDITNRILRKDNIMIALVNMDLLDMHLPFIGNVMMNNVLEWNLRMCILTGLFNPDFSVRRDFLSTGNILKRRFFIMGILNLFLMPFILVFMVIFFFLKYADEFHSKQTYLGPREFTNDAKWKIRDFNELPHFLHDRLSVTYPLASDYLAQFPSRSVSLIATTVAFVSGALVAVLLLLTLIDSALLTHFTIWNKTLLWYLTVLAALTAVARSLITPDPSTFEPEVLLRKISSTLHYYPECWKSASPYRVCEAFASLYRPKVLIFLQSIFGAFITPLVLMKSLPRCADSVVEFLDKSMIKVSGVGDVCGFALFNFERDGSTANFDGVQQSKQFKMEKSVLNFAINHPTWEVPASIASVLDPIASKVLTASDQDLTSSFSQILQNRVPPYKSNRAVHMSELFAVFDDETNPELFGSQMELSVIKE